MVLYNERDMFPTNLVANTRGISVKIQLPVGLVLATTKRKRQLPRFSIISHYISFCYGKKRKETGNK